MGNLADIVWISHHWSIPGKLIVPAIAIQLVAIYFFGWRLARVLGIKARIWPFVTMSLALLGMMVPRVITTAHVEGWGFAMIETVNLVNAVIYLLNSTFFALSGWGLCRTFAEMFVFYSGPGLPKWTSELSHAQKEVLSTAAVKAKDTLSNAVEEVQKLEEKKK